MAVHYEVQVVFLYKRLCETCAGSQRKPEDNLREKIALRSNLGGGLSLILTEWIERLIPFQDTELKKRLFFVGKQGRRRMQCALRSSSRRERLS